MSKAIIRAIQDFSPDFYRRVVAGEIEGYSIVHKFGRNKAVGTTFVPIAIGGVYRTPQVGGATKIRVKAGDAKDDAAASGAREISVLGLDASGVEITNTLITSGTSAGASSSSEFIRAYRAFVSKSGTYATQSVGSHEQPIVIENGAGTEDWMTIDGSAGSFPRGQSEIGVYSIPSGYKAYLISAFGFSDTAKVTTLLFFRREAILQTSPPYDAMRVLFEERLEGGEFSVEVGAPIGPIQGPADVGFLAKVNATTGEVDVDFELLLVQD